MCIAFTLELEGVVNKTKLTLYDYLITVTPNVSKEVEGCQKYINGDAM